MSCCAGLNTYTGLSVPATNIDGLLTSVANLAARKTIYLTGTFNGDYIILGSHDNIDFVPIAKFNGNGNPQAAKRDIDATLQSVRVRRNADAGAVITISGQATCFCTFDEGPPPGMAPGGKLGVAGPGVRAAAAVPVVPKQKKPGEKGSFYPKAGPSPHRHASPAPAAKTTAAPAADKTDPDGPATTGTTSKKKGKAKGK